MFAYILYILINKNTKNKKTDKRQKELTYKKSKSQKKTGQRLKV